MRNYIQFGPFLGVIGSLDPEMIPDNSAADMLNVTVEDGVIRPRYGYRNLAAHPGNFGASWGLDYIQGFDSGGNVLEEYLSFESISGTLTPVSRNVATGNRQVITNNGSSVAMAVPTYGQQPGIRAISFNNYGYVISPNDTLTAGTSSTLYRHSIGVANSFLPLTPPKAPTAAPVVQFYDGASDTETGSVDTMLWDDNSGTSLAYAAVSQSGSGISVPASPTDGHGALTINHATNGSGSSTGQTFQPSLNEGITINLQGAHGPGQQDFTYVDRIVLEFTTNGWTIENQNFTISLSNASGTVFTPTQTTVYEPPDNTWAQNHFLVAFDFDYKSPRTDYSTIRQITISWTTLGAAGSGAGITPTLIVKPLKLGQPNVTALDDGGNPVNLIVGYTYYSSVTGLESPLSPTLQLTPKQLQGYTVPSSQFRYPQPDLTYRARPKLFLTKNTGTGYDGEYDHYRLWGRRSTDTDWFLIQDLGLASPPSVAGEIATGATGAGGSNKIVAGLTYDATANIRCNWNELSTSSVFALGGKGQWTGLISGCAYKGWMVWGFKGGIGNLQHSAIGQPEALYSTYDLTLLNPSNTAAPANFTLADNGADDPVAMFPLTQSLLILGNTGIYAQSGYSPTTMSPPKRLPTSFGCAGQYACCLWHDEIGNPGVAFVSRNGEGVYLAQEDLYYLDAVHYKVAELTQLIRGRLLSFLLQGSLSNLGSLRMGVDWTKDALWLICQNRAMVLRRPSLADQQRHWEFYEFGFSEGAIANICFETRNRMRWIRTTGEFDENEWNSSTLSFISGALADAGSARPSIYYTTKKMAGPMVTRISHVEVDRESLSDTPSIEVVSSRQSETQTVPSGKYFTRFGALQQGREHQFTIWLSDSSAGGVRRVLVETLGPIGDRFRS